MCQGRSALCLLSDFIIFSLKLVRIFVEERVIQTAGNRKANDEYLSYVEKLRRNTFWTQLVLTPSTAPP